MSSQMSLDEVMSLIALCENLDSPGRAALLAWGRQLMRATEESKVYTQSLSYAWTSLSTRQQEGLVRLCRELILMNTEET